jgi:transposase
MKQAPLATQPWSHLAQAAKNFRKAQMQLFELEPVVSEMTEQAESEQVPVRQPTNVSEKHPGRQELPANSSHRAGSALHGRSAHVQTLRQETVVIGYEESSQLDVEPAKYFVLVTKREMRACRSWRISLSSQRPCRDGSSRSAWRVTASLSRRSSAKYCDHMPLNRQSMVLERDLRTRIFIASSLKTFRSRNSTLNPM